MGLTINGTNIAFQIKNELKQNISDWLKKGHRAPSICCIIIGDTEANQMYSNQILQAAEYVGINAEVSSETLEEQLVKNIRDLNADINVDGILLTLPVPAGISERNISNAIAPEKDVDGFNMLNAGKLYLDMPSIVPATALAVVEILKRFNVVTFGRNAVVISRSKHIGLPIAVLLHSDGRHESGLGMDATVTICHRYTPKEKLDFFCQNADIITTATSLSKLITKNMVKHGATVTDVGLGDVDFEEVSQIASVTPVRGGVGPVTVAMLLQNTLQVAQKNLSRI